MNGRLFLIDGHALIFKMYYAFLRRPMVNSKGADMSILYGFTKYLLELIDREQPTHLAVAFDPPGGTFRNEMFPAYKGTRPPTPQLIIDALEPLTELVGAMNIPVLMVKGFEADDVIGTVAVRSAAEGMDVFMVTPDKDYGQLISDHIFQLKPGKAGSDNELVDKAAVCAKWGIDDPAQVIDMLAICGDSADNVPGVKGVGEVGAAKLIAQFGTLERIYDHLGELTAKQQALFGDARDHMPLSKALVTIKTDVPVDIPLDAMALDTAYQPLLADLFEKYEFGSLKRYIRHIAAAKPAADDAAPAFAVRTAEPAEVMAAARKQGAAGLVCHAAGTGLSAPAEKVTLAAGDLAATAAPDAFAAVLEDAAVVKYGADLKLASHWLENAGVTLQGRRMDIGLMHYLISPETSHKLDILAKSYLGIDLETPVPAEAGSLFETVVDEGPDPLREAAAALRLGQKLYAELGPLAQLYDTMEEPLSKVLAQMERDGVKVDLSQIQAFADGLRAELVERESRIRAMADAPDLNISSPKQVGELLFDRLKLDPKAKKNARGQYTTDEATLLEIADRHPVVDEILEFRAVKKLLSTYIEPFPSFVSPRDGRVHTTFNQALTATGRLSSSNPNLQNIPIRTDRGREIRKAFVPGTPDGLVMSADYSQIELRVMAHLSQDEHLIRAFREGIDVHAATAAKIFGIPHAEVTSDQRRIAKTANFGIMYGISSFGLAQRLRIGRKEAKQLIEDYFASFPAIRSFIDASIESARENGYVETLFGRRRFLPDIKAGNATVRALAERNAVNAPIQGTAADIIKLAMLRVARRMEGMRSRMVLQIHDELLFDVVPDEAETLRGIVVEEMEHVLSLSVPLTVECNIGKNWLEAH